MPKAPLAAALACAALAAAAGSAAGRWAPRLPPLSELPSTPFVLQDAVLVSAGMRAAAADLAWVELLQYSAGGLPDMPDRPGRVFDRMKDMSLRVTRLAPSFRRAYLYGASILAWFRNVDRPDEALEVLRQGLRDDPGERSYSVYMAAIAFQKKGDVDRTVVLLESTLSDPHSPIETRAILANLYKTRGEYAKALAVWEAILDDDDARREWPRARVQEAEIKALMRPPRPSPARPRP